MSSPTSSAEPAVSLKNLHVAYRQAPALLGVNLSVARGEIVAVFGPSAAGKSSLLAALAGLVKPLQGEARLNGHPAGTQAARRTTGYMPQADGLLDDMSVEENLRFFASLMGPACATPERLDGLLGLIELRKRRAEPLSGLTASQRGRVSLGVALAGDPDVLLLDEPFASADSAFVERFWAHLRERAARGAAVIVATGQAAIAARADRVAVLRAGRLLNELVPASLAPAGKARVVLRFRDKERSALREQAHELQDYRQELIALLGQPTRPVEVEVFPASIEGELARYLSEELSNVGSRP